MLAKLPEPAWIWPLLISSGAGCASAAGAIDSAASAPSSIDTLRSMTSPSPFLVVQAVPEKRAAELAFHRLPTMRGQLEMPDLESRRDCAAHQGPRPQALGRLPGIRRHHDLWTLAVAKAVTETMYCHRLAIRRDPQFERSTAIPIPDLGGIDAMPSRDLTLGQQIVDRGAAAP